MKTRAIDWGSDMEDQKKTKAQLIAELAEMRRRIEEQGQKESERKRAEENYRTLIETVDAGLNLISREGEFLLVNSHAASLWDLAPEDMIGKNVRNVFPPGEFIDDCFEAIERIRKTGEGFQHERYVEPSGKWILASVQPVRHETGEFYAIQVLTYDITERKQAEETLRNSERRLSLVTETIDDVFWMTDWASHRTIYVSAAYEKIWGRTAESLYESLSGWADAIYPEDQQRAWDRFVALGEEQEYDEEYRMIKPDGSIRWIRDRGFPIVGEEGTVEFVVGTAQDITDHKRAEEEKVKLEAQLRRAQKLETVGTLAGGIAHDFNNILTPILGYTEMALQGLEPTDPLAEDLQNVLEAAIRAQDLVQQILLFSKQTEKERTPLRLQEIVKEALKLLRPSIPSTIDIRHRIDNSCASVRADATQMHQVIVNLCTNAGQAMREEGGALTIELTQTNVDAGTASLYPNLTEGEYVCLSVIDTGPGMDEILLDRVFEPFFTTKAIDEGTGLGLSVVHGIVRSHEGDVLVDSEPGKGSTFRVYLPTASAELKASEAESEAGVGGRESILLVDDEPAIVDVMKTMLERYGYKVDAYHSSFDVLKAFREQPDKYDLLISDLTMPNMTGLDLSDRLHKDRPELPVMIMTGFGDSLTVATREKYGVKQAVKKPILLKDLAAAVRKVLDG